MVEVKKKPLTLNKSVDNAVVTLDSQGGSEDTINVHQGQLSVYRAEILLTYEEVFSIANKYLGVFSWQAQKSGRSLEVGVHPPWDKITDFEELEKRHKYNLWDLKVNHWPGEIFYAVGPHKIMYIGKFVDQDGDEEYFAYLSGSEELLLAPK